MKRVALISVILALTILGCNKPKPSGYIFLNAEQLKPLGIELSEKGVFYKNYNPKWSEDNEKYAYLGFYSTNDVYLNTFHYKENDTLEAENRNDSIFIGKEITQNDFYPVLIGNTKGDYSLDRENKNIKLLPIAICMAETKLSSRTDTLLVWFKPTESLQKVLPSSIKVEDYIRLPESAK